MIFFLALHHLVVAGGKTTKYFKVSALQITAPRESHSPVSQHTASAIYQHDYSTVPTRFWFWQLLLW